MGNSLTFKIKQRIYYRARCQLTGVRIKKRFKYKHCVGLISIMLYQFCLIFLEPTSSTIADVYILLYGFQISTYVFVNKLFFE